MSMVQQYISSLLYAPFSPTCHLLLVNILLYIFIICINLTVGTSHNYYFPSYSTPTGRSLSLSSSVWGAFRPPFRPRWPRCAPEYKCFYLRFVTSNPQFTSSENWCYTLATLVTSSWEDYARLLRSRWRSLVDHLRPHQDQGRLMGWRKARVST